MTEVTDDPEAGGSVGGGTTPEEGAAGWSAEEEMGSRSKNLCKDNPPAKSAENSPVPASDRLISASENRDASDTSLTATTCVAMTVREKSESALEDESIGSDSPADATAALQLGSTVAALSLLSGPLPTVTTTTEDGDDSREGEDGNRTPLSTKSGGGCEGDGSDGSFLRDDPATLRDATMTRVARIVGVVMAPLVVLLFLAVYFEITNLSRFRSVTLISLGTHDGLLALSLLGTSTMVTVVVRLWAFVDGGQTDSGRGASVDETGERPVDKDGQTDENIETGCNWEADDDGRDLGRVINPKIVDYCERLRGNDRTLTELYLGNVELDAIDAVALADALMANTTLTYLDVSYTRIDAKGFAALASALKANTTLAALYFDRSQLGDEGAATFADVLKVNTTLTALSLIGNGIGAEGAAALADALKHNSTLAKMHLGSNGIGKEGVPELADALKADNNTLSAINIEYNGIGDEGAAALAKALKTNTTLTTIDVVNNDIGEEGAAALADALKANTTLTTLDMGENRICDEGAAALADALKANVALTAIDVKYNGIGKEGAAALAKALKANSTLTTLDVKYNGIRADGAAALADALKTNTTLTTLNVDRNWIGEEGAAALADALKTNAALTTLDVNSNEFGNEGAVALAGALKANAALTTLRLISTGIGDEGAVALADALTVNNTLTTLDVKSNEIGITGAAAFANAFKANTTLTTFDGIGGNLEVLSSASEILFWVFKRNRIFKDHEAAVKDKLHGEIFYAQRKDTSWENRAHANGSESGKTLSWSTGRWIGEIGSPPLPITYSARCWQPAMGGNGPSEEIGPATSKSSDESGGKMSTSCPIWEAAIGDGAAFKHFVQLFDRPDPPFTLHELKDLIQSNTDKDGSTLLHVAAGKDSQAALELCRFLVEKVEADFDTITDGSGRTAREIAVGNSNPNVSKWARTVGRFLNRYYIEGGLSAPPVHKSATCTVHFAVDMELEKGDPNRHVALKIMNEKKNGHMERELNVRLTGQDREGDDIPQGVNRFEIDHAVPLLRYHDTPEYDCLVMPMGEKNLLQIIDSEQIAGKDLDKVLNYGNDIAKALDHLHSKHNIIHGDFKPRNVVRINGDMKLIDFDASVTIDSDLTEKFSSAYIPPEVARSRFNVSTDPEVLKQERKEKLKQLNRAAEEGNDEKAESLGYEITILSKKIKAASSPDQPTKTTAQVSMDIWAFGVTMYYLCTGEALFVTNLKDNIVGESEQLRLVNWSGLNIKNLNGVLKESGNQAAREAAQEFLERCLHKDPDQRFQTVNELLSHRFLKKRYSSVAGKMEKIAKNQAENTKIIHNIDKKTDATIQMLSDLQNRLEIMQDRIQKSLRKMTYGILKSTAAPRLFHVVPDKFAFKELFTLNSIMTKKVTLYFICPVTFSVPRDTLGNPMGYEVVVGRDWVKKYGPALFMSLTVLKVAFAIGRLTGLPLPNLASVGESSNVLQVVADNVLDFMQNEEVGEGLAPKLQEVAEAMETVTTISVPVDGPEFSTEKNLSEDRLQARDYALEQISRSYEEVKKIAEHENDPEFLRSGLVKAVHVDNNGDVSEEYVVPDVVKLFEEKGRDCLGWNREELFRAKIAQMEVAVEGELEKQSKRKHWKGNKQYFILRQSGFLTYYDSKDLRDIDFMGVKGKTKPERVKEIKEVSSTANCQHELVFTYHDGGTQLFRTASPGEKNMWLDGDKVFQTSNRKTQR